MLLSASWIYDSFAPSRHFRTAQLPVLATPLSQPDRTGETPAKAVFLSGASGESIEGNGKGQSSDRSETMTSSPIQENAADLANASNLAAASHEPQRQSSGFNLLVLGLDNKEAGAGRSDSIMVVHVDPQKKTVNIVSVPRDTRVTLQGIGLTKVNHAYFLGELRGGGKEGTQAAIGAVSSLFDIPIHYYIKTDLQGFVAIIDEIGGVDLELTRDMLLSGSGTTLPAGSNHLDGKLALQFVRERYSLSGGDFDRQSDQAALLKAVTGKLLSGEKLKTLPGLVRKVLNDYVDTNLTAADIVSLALLFKNTDGGIRHFTLPGKPVIEEDPLVGSKLWYWSADAREVDNIAREYLR
ncbi:hypothetical protein GCM10020370_13060 [Paenibacillus hodogayensis]